MVRIPLALVALTAFLASSGSRLDAGSAAATGLLTSSQDGWLGVMLLVDAESPTILEVIPDSPAAAAGLRPGDVILAVDDVEIESLSDLQRELGDKAVGSEVLLSLDRGGERITVGVKLQRSPEVSPSTRGIPVPRLGAPAKPSGAASDVDQDRAGKAYLGVRVRQEGDSVQIEEVVADSPAAKAGLEVGDRLKSIDGQQIDNLQDLERAMARLRPGQQVRIRIERGDSSRRLRVSMGGAAADKVEAAKKAEREPRSTSKQSKKPATDSRRPTADERQKQAERNEQVRADLERARDQMQRERAALAAELRQARAENARSLQQAMREIAEVRARIEAEMQQAKAAIEDQRRQAQDEMMRERKNLADEMQSMRSQAEAESKLWQREIDKQRREFEHELARANKQAEQEARRAHEKMSTEREQFQRELDRAREQAEEERRRFHRGMAREQAMLVKQMEAEQRGAEENMARQRERFDKELSQAREEMDRARRRLSQPARPPASPTSGPSHGGASGSGRNQGGLRSELRRIRAELRELLDLVKRKREPGSAQA